MTSLSQQQKAFSGGGLAKYRSFLVGNRGWLYYLGFELYNLVLMDLATGIGMGLRRAILPAFLAEGGKKAVIGRGVTIRQPGKIRLGNGVIIDEFALLDFRERTETAQVAPEEQGLFLDDGVLLGRGSFIIAKGGRIHLKAGCNISSSCRIATESQVTIGESTLIAAYCYIGPGNHSSDNPGLPLIEQRMDIRGGVTIGKNCWIGTRATILDGVSIGDNAIVGAHALVREDVPENAIVAGVPARIIRMRTPGDTVEAHQIRQ